MSLTLYIIGASDYVVKIIKMHKPRTLNLESLQSKGLIIMFLYTVLYCELPNFQEMTK